MQDDVLMFNTKWLKEMKEKLFWGRMDVNLFLVGMSGVVTPAHYDIMENLFLQVYLFIAILNLLGSIGVLVNHKHELDMILYYCKMLYYGLENFKYNDIMQSF